MTFKIPGFSRTKPPRFDSFAEAVAMLPKGQDYQDKELVDVVVRKTEVFVASQKSKTPLDLNIARMLIALGPLLKQEQINVLDFGGAAGVHFFIAKQALGKGARINWRVLETTQMASAAKQLEQEGLKFFDDLDEATHNLSRIDLVIASSALQYCENPLDILIKLIGLSPKFLFITKTPFTEEVVPWSSIQTSNLRDNGPGPLPEGFVNRKVHYPIQFAPIRQVESVLQKRYVTRYSLDEGQWIRQFPGIRAWGFFGELVSQSDLNS
jgi:putative methyltransferase (TIGR04325 family)